MLALLVQTATGTSNLASTTVTFTNNNVNGNSIIVAVGNSSTSAGDVSGITDTQGNTYQKAFAADNSLVGDLEVWYASNIVGGANTITVAYTTGVSCAVIAREYYGTAYNLTSILDKQISATGNSNALSSGATTNVSQLYELVIGAGLIPLGDTFTVGAGFNNLTTLSGPLAIVVAMEDQLVTNSGKQTATFGANTTLQWVCGVATFYLAPTGTTTSTSSITTTTSTSSTSVSSTSSSISSTSSSTSISSTSTSFSSTSSSISSTSSSTSSTSISSTSSSTSISSTSSSISSTSVSSTSQSSTSSSTSISSTSSSFSSTSSSISSTSHSTSSTSVSSTSSSSSTSTTLPPPNLSYSYQDVASTTASFDLSDDFSSLNSAIWTNVSFTGGTATISGGMLVLTPAANTANTAAEIDSVSKYSLINSYVVIKVPTVSAQNSSTNLILAYDGLNEVYMAASGNTLSANQETNGQFNQISPSVTYNAITMAYWRIRETGGLTFFEYSSDGISWTQLWNIKNPFPMNNLQVILQVFDGNSDSSPGTAVIDSLNLVALPLVNSFTNPQYGNANVDDGDYFIEKGTQYLISQYKSKHQNNTDNIIFTWKGRSTLSTLISPILIQIFNVNSGSWETLADQTLVPADTDFQVTVSHTTNVGNYYDANNIVTFRSYQQVI